MKISRLVRELYADLHPQYVGLQKNVDSLVFSNKEPRWHYESRIKGEESFALKLETGRVPKPEEPEDLFACTLVVQNHSKIADAESLVKRLFAIKNRRPQADSATHLSPENFGFDDLRLYVSWKDDLALPPTSLSDIVFEIQIKTFLQHAWGIATHDFVYKSDDVDWAESRIAFQVKAMLEHAELSIGEARKLSGAKLLGRCDRRHSELKETIKKIASLWESAQLPADLKRLAENIINLARLLRLSLDDIWSAVDSATTEGLGAKLLHLSPYSAVIDSLIRKRGKDVFRPLGNSSVRGSIYIPEEIILPEMDAAVKDRIIRCKGSESSRFESFPNS